MAKPQSGEHCASVEQFSDGQQTCTFPSVHLPKILLLTVQFQILNIGARCLIHLAHCNVLSGTSRENKQVHFCFSGCVLESDVLEIFKLVSSSGSAFWLTDLFRVPSHILRTFHVTYSYIKPSDLDTGFLL